MEKICIVKLRKKMTNPAAPNDGFGQGNLTRDGRVSEGFTFPAAGNRGTREAQEDGQAGADSGKKGGATVSLLLNKEQGRSLRSNPYLASVLSVQAAGGSEAGSDHDEPIVIKLEFNAMAPVRLLKMGEAAQMLRMSKGYLKKVINLGMLRSYKFGRLRRIRLDDLLSYLEDHMECPDAGPQAVKARTTRHGIV